MREFNEYLMIKGLRYVLKSTMSLKDAIQRVIPFVPDKKYAKTTKPTKNKKPPNQTIAIKPIIYPFSILH